VQSLIAGKDCRQDQREIYTPQTMDSDSVLQGQSLFESLLNKFAHNRKIGDISWFEAFRIVKNKKRVVL